MAEPLFFNDTYGIRAGRATDFVSAAGRVVATLEANPTRHLYFAFCMNESGTEYSNLQIHPEAQSMVEHMQLVAEHIQTAAEVIDFSTGHEELYGEPNAALLDQLAQWGTSINRPVVGFSRLGAAAQTSSVLGPLVVLNTYTVKDGLVHDYMAVLEQWFARDQDKPQPLHDKVYISEGGTIATEVQVHVDSRAMERHLPVYAERLANLQVFIDTDTMSIELVGSPTDVVVNGLRRATGANPPMHVKTPTVGFSRLPIGSSEQPDRKPVRVETLGA